MKTITSGFTLIELVITVAIVAILAAIAYPSYQDSVRRSRRADAKAVMVEAAQFMERRYTANSCFDNPCGSGTAPALPGGLTAIPRNAAAASEQFYTIALGNVTRNTYTLTATPQNAQVHDKCRTLTVDNNGVRTADGKPASDALTLECWGR